MSLKTPSKTSFKPQKRFKGVSKKNFVAKMFFSAYDTQKLEMRTDFYE